ncbi:hypothetical protein ACTJK4_08275 [Ralstonia sp. 22111]|uniref:hypothetical protein n=1 Tax=Ralstonia TaxID=48736 RepID=UPI0039C623A2
MHPIDPARPAEAQGTVTQFLMNEHGDLDGFILDKIWQVYFSPRMSASVAAHVTQGDTVRVQGAAPLRTDVMSVFAIEAEDGETIVDMGPGRNRSHGSERDVQKVPVDLIGTVVLPLYGPKGEPCGVLLGGGTSLRMAVRAAQELARYLAPGTRVHAWGELVSSELASTLDVATIALASDGVGHPSARAGRENAAR